MPEDEAKSLAGVVRRVTGHDVEVRAEDSFFVVDVRRADPVTCTRSVTTRTGSG